MPDYIALVAESFPPEAKLRLSDYAEVCPLPPDENLPFPVRCHPDMITTVFRGKMYLRRVYLEKNRDYLSNICEKSGIAPVPVDAPYGDYPLDTALNALVIPDRSFLVGRKKSLAAPLSALCAVNTNQGYAGCAALYAAHHVISADPSVLFSCKKAGLSVFALPGGGIELPGYNTGFVGGCGGFLGSIDTLFILGEPSSCPAGAALEAFCADAAVKLISLSSGRLLDLGGIKFIPKK